jgi:hypothetical protein
MLSPRRSICHTSVPKRNTDVNHSPTSTSSGHYYCRTDGDAHHRNVCVGPRIAETQRLVKEATLDHIPEIGFEGKTVELIAGRSGVSDRKLVETENAESRSDKLGAAMTLSVGSESD